MTAYIDHVPDQDEGAADRLQPRIAAAVVDVFVYVVVLNLFVEYLPQVISETFTLSLLTAVLLKGVLEIVVAAKNRVKARFRQASTPMGKVVAAVLLRNQVLAGDRPRGPVQPRSVRSDAPTQVILWLWRPEHRRWHHAIT